MLISDRAFQLGQHYVELLQIERRLPCLRKEAEQVRFQAYKVIAVTIVLVLLGFGMSFSEWPWYYRHAPTLGLIVCMIPGCVLAWKGAKLRQEVDALVLRAFELAKVDIDG